jgi:peptidoglycan/LPS O-acetylase OafA/YrhL
MLVSELLDKKKNNFTLLRLLAAWAVIFGHAFALVPATGRIDPVQGILGFTYSGAIAVKVFFFISGLLVTNSLISGSSAYKFIINRVFRIWPGLIFAVFTLALLVGPMLSDLSAAKYFESSETYRFIIDQVLMPPSTSIQATLPGVFQHQPWQIVDGSLWTIPFELCCYAALICFWVLGLQKVRYAALLLASFTTVAAFLPENWFWPQGEIKWALVSFSWGCALAMLQNKIRINLPLVLALGTLAFLCRNSQIFEPSVYFALFALLIYVFSLNSVVKIRLPGDYSYGVYLWGWPVQQISIEVFNFSSVFSNQISTICLSTIIGILSWHFVEKPAMRIAKLFRI